ncbi:MAG TPA: amidohydrolase family protein [Bryobacteraceae bacterium]
MAQPNHPSISPSPITRDSPWGPLQIADAHVHFFSCAFFAALLAQKPGLTLEAAGAQLGWTMPGEDPVALADAWIAELDRHGVAKSALMASFPGDESSVNAAVAAYPTRFFAFAMANPKAWRVETFGGIQVACLFPAMHCYSIQDDSVHAIFDWADEGGRAVFVHCGVLSVGVRGKLGLPSPFDMRFSNPIDVHAVALRHPGVPIIVPHFGAGFLRETLMLADLCPNVFLDTASSNRWVRYLEPHHSLTRVDLRHVFRQALDVVGPKRLLFGTDSSYFPRGWHAAIFEEQARALYEIGLSAADARAIFGENLIGILAR